LTNVSISESGSLTDQEIVRQVSACGSDAEPRSAGKANSERDQVTPVREVMVAASGISSRVLVAPCVCRCCRQRLPAHIGHRSGGCGRATP